MTANETERLELTISRTIPAPPSAVFEAWTNPDKLATWWRPPDGHCTGAAVDLRRGGRYEIINEVSDGVIITITGEFLDIHKPDLLTYTWRIDAEGASDELVTVRFDPDPDGTLVTVHHERIPSIEIVRGHELGWQSCLNGLDEYV